MVKRVVKRGVKRFRRLSRILQIFALLFLLFAGITAYRVYDYTENDPKFCTTCHLMQSAWDRWATSEHRKVTCHACHHASKIESARQVWLVITRQRTRVEKHAHVPPERCEECHRSGDPQWIQVAQTAGHKVHAAKAKITCVRCHSKSLHRFRPAAEICRECHARETVKITGMGQLHCTNCHSFLASKANLLPTRNDCLWCHEKQVAKTVEFSPDSPMQYECQKCHNPHKKIPPTKSCETCHPGPFVGREKLPEKHQDCISCHKPHTWKVNSSEVCKKCHKSMDRLSKPWVHGNGHKILKCQDCHQPHEWKVSGPQLCRKCHKLAALQAFPH